MSKWNGHEDDFDRIGPFYAVAFHRDMAETMRNGSSVARGRARLLSRLLMLCFLAIPASLYLLGWILGW